MISERVLMAVLVAEAVLLAIGLLLFFGHGAWATWDTRRTKERMAKARSALVAALESGRLPDAADELKALPFRMQIRLVGAFAPNLEGDSRIKMRAVAADAGLLPKVESWCKSRRWWLRLRGARVLTMLGAGQLTIPKLFEDDHAEVRAQAAEWAADHASYTMVEKLIALLDDDRTLCRFTVQDSLQRMARIAVEPLAERLAGRTERPVEDALRAAGGLTDPRLLDPVLALSQRSSPTSRARAAAILGTMGGPQGTQRLTAMLDDPDESVRAAAARALGKLADWSAAPRLATLLRDPAWSVRLAAGLALHAVGSPGVLMLNRSLDDADRFAADMARQVLDLAGKVDELPT